MHRFPAYTLAEGIILRKLGLTPSDQHATKEKSDGSSLKPSRATSSRSPSYLYRRKNILYFRYVFTAEQQKLFGSSEIRISLKTGFLREARKKVRCIFAKLQEFSLKNEFIRMSDLRQSLSEMLESHEESASQEQRLSLAEIRRRIDDFRQKILESGDLKFYQPESPIDLSDGKPVPLMSPSQYLDCNLKLLLNVVNDKDFLTSPRNIAILNDLINNGVFKFDELTR